VSTRPDKLCLSRPGGRVGVRRTPSAWRGRSCRSLAFPLIGAGTGDSRPEQVQAIMEDEIKKSEFPGEVSLVRFKRSGEPPAALGGGPVTPLGNSGVTEGPRLVS
jgi:hypothetical protein